MILKLEPADAQWVRLRGCAKPVVTFIRFSLKSAYRRFNKDEGAWEIHNSSLPNLAHLATKYQSGSDCSSLPEEWRCRFLGIKFEASVPETSPYTALHLTSDAPIELVRAAYRTLSFIHHPDRGGDSQRFQSVADAYRKVLAIRGTAAV